jgi:hypothetical protein
LAHITETLPPEIEILVCCARKNLADTDRFRLAELVRPPLDWILLLRLASEHGLVPLLERHLREIETERLPEDFLLSLRREARENSIRALFLSAELQRVLVALRAGGISAVTYKGPTLAERAYGDASLRSFNDLDIVIPQKFMTVVREGMASLGYRTKLAKERFVAVSQRDIPGEYAFVHEANGARIEIHTEFTLRHFPRIPDLEGMIERASTLSCGGKEIPVFAVEDDLLLLAVHGAKDLWARLLWVADVAELVKQSKQFDWTEAFARAESMKSARMLRLSLTLATEIPGLTLPRYATELLGKDSTAIKLATTIRRRLLGLTRMSDGVLARSLYRIRTVDGFWAGVNYWLRLSAGPAEEDWSAPTVPQSMRHSYGILRPMRLGRKYGPRVSRSE